MEETWKLFEDKIENLTLTLPDGTKKETTKTTDQLFGRKIVFTDNPRNIEAVTISRTNDKIKLIMLIDGEEKIAYAGYREWIENDLYPQDFTKRYHKIAYGMDEEALYLSVGLINTSYKEEYCLWVNSKGIVVGTWKPNVTYLPQRDDMTWKFTGKFN